MPVEATASRGRARSRPGNGGPPVEIPEDTFRAIAEEIASDTSPVGIDAKKTHVIILHKLIEIEKRLGRLEHRFGGDPQ